MEHQRLLGALATVVVSWGDADLRVPAWVAWRVRAILSGATALDPRPLPPREGPHPDPWRAAEGRPVPWRLTVASVGALEALVSMHAAASVAADAERARKAVSARFRAAVDDFCGTPPRYRFPFPPFPPRGDDADVLPADALAAAAVFHAAFLAVRDEALGADLGQAAERLLGRALEG